MSLAEEFERVAVYATGVTCKKKLAAANERIRELDQYIKDLQATENAQLAAEREVSDKLEKALRTISKYFTSGNCIPVDQATIKTTDFRSITDAALAEVAAIRAGG